MSFKATVTDTDRQFIIDNPNLKSNVIKQFINVSTTQINRIKKEVYGKITWFHDGNRYPYLNKSDDGYRVRYAGNLIAKTINVDFAMKLIDTMIIAIERNYFERVEYERGNLKDKLVNFKLPPVFQIAKRSDFDEKKYHRTQREVIIKRARK